MGDLYAAVAACGNEFFLLLDLHNRSNEFGASALDLLYLCIR